jgi:hypothetical protein
MGRPPYVPTPEQKTLVERLIGAMLPERVIASSLLDPPMARNTFRKHFREEIRRGRDRLRGRLRLLMWRSAEAGNVTAIIYLIKRLDPELQDLNQNGAATTPDAGRIPVNNIHIYQVGSRDHTS